MSQSEMTSWRDMAAVIIILTAAAGIVLLVGLAVIAITVIIHKRKMRMEYYPYV